ncbi:hypothetical protein [Streptomyces sp. KR55]|uniref:hypothetical protein n=1 Tax=Streptomyces sp. KR55 TaxID=3457425 RepID=UPI003FD02E8C
MRHIGLSATFTAGVALAATAGHPVVRRPAGAAAHQGGDGATSGETTVRLITGDSVTVAKGPDGRQTASVRPGPGRDGIVFHTFEQDGHLTVLPSDASPLVSQGRLDRRRGADQPRQPPPGAEHFAHLPRLGLRDRDRDDLVVPFDPQRQAHRAAPPPTRLRRTGRRPQHHHPAGSYGGDVTVRAQGRAPAPHGSRVQVEISYDDGRTWRPANVHDRGHDTFRATVDRPRHRSGASYVTLRVTARDSAGNSVQQTVSRAWAERC